MNGRPRILPGCRCGPESCEPGYRWQSCWGRPHARGAGVSGRPTGCMTTSWSGPCPRRHRPPGAVRSELPAVGRADQGLDFRVQDNPATRLAAVELAPRGDCAAQPPPPTDAQAYLSVACGERLRPEWPPRSGMPERDCDPTGESYRVGRNRPVKRATGCLVESVDEGSADTISLTTRKMP